MYTYKFTTSIKKVQDNLLISNVYISLFYITSVLFCFSSLLLLFLYSPLVSEFFTVPYDCPRNYFKIFYQFSPSFRKL
jgi:hypothetical protein